jgi:hypothetical protein
MLGFYSVFGYLHSQWVTCIIVPLHDEVHGLRVNNQNSMCDVKKRAFMCFMVADSDQACKVMDRNRIMYP